MSSPCVGLCMYVYVVKCDVFSVSSPSLCVCLYVVKCDVQSSVSSNTHDLCRGPRAHRINRTLACVSRTPRARSPQRVAREQVKSHSRLHFAHSTRTISAEGCAGTGQIALSPAFRALDAHDLRRGLRARRSNRTLACISRTRRVRSPQGVARAPDKSHSRLHFAHSTRGDRRGLRARRTNRTLACISRTRRARSPQRVARASDKSRSRLHFARSTRAISAEGCIFS